MAARPTSLYRNIIREFRLSDTIHKYSAHRSRSATFKHLRQLLQEKTRDIPAQQAQLAEMAAFLKANRIHQELLERYNAGINMTQEERSRLTARRVGLNMPKEYEGQ